MSKPTKTAPADTGNAIMSVWPSEINAAGVVVKPLRSVEYKPKGKSKVSVTLEVAYMRLGNGPITLLLGAVRESGSGQPCSVHGTAYESIGAAAAAACADHLAPVGIACTAEELTCDLSALIPIGKAGRECAEALGITEDELDAFLEGDAQPKDATPAADTAPVQESPAPRVLGHSTQQVRIDYTDAQTIEHSRKLAATHKAIADIEARKQRANQQFKMELEAQQDLIEDYSGRIREGYYMREQACTIYADTPEKGKKCVVRDDTGETLAVYPMNHGDYQAELPLGDKRKVAAPVTIPADDDDADAVTESGDDE